MKRKAAWFLAVVLLLGMLQIAVQAEEGFTQAVANRNVGGWRLSGRLLQEKLPEGRTETRQQVLQSVSESMGAVFSGAQKRLTIIPCLSLPGMLATSFREIENRRLRKRSETVRRRIVKYIQWKDSL